MIDWDHNAYYHRYLLGLLPQGCHRVLDVGCGVGVFASRLAQRSEHVDAIDRSEVMVATARSRTPGNVVCLQRDVLTDPLPQREYDAIVSISALHHVPLDQVLPILASALRPGGVLAAVALPRRDLLREFHVELAASIAHRILGVLYALKRVWWGRARYAKGATYTDMPVVMDPPLTTREVSTLASKVLPGVKVRRLLFWRYSLMWTKPE